MALVTLRVFQNEFEAELAKNLLKTNGIKCYSSGGISPPAMGGVPYGSVVQVEENDFVRATQVLAELRQKQSKPRESQRLAKTWAKTSLLGLFIIILLPVLLVLWIWLAN